MGRVPQELFEYLPGFTRLSCLGEIPDQAEPDEIVLGIQAQRVPDQGGCRFVVAVEAEDGRRLVELHQLQPVGPKLFRQRVHRLFHPALLDVQQDAQPEQRAVIRLERLALLQVIAAVRQALGFQRIPGVDRLKVQLRQAGIQDHRRLDLQAPL